MKDSKCQWKNCTFLDDTICNLQCKLAGTGSSLQVSFFGSVIPWQLQLLLIMTLLDNFALTGCLAQVDRVYEVLFGHLKVNKSERHQACPQLISWPQESSHAFESFHIIQEGRGLVSLSTNFPLALQGLADGRLSANVSWEMTKMNEN